MKLQQLYSKTRQAVDDYHMIQSGDKIAIGVSGGKDSLALLYALNGLKSFYSAPFDICAITVDLGFENVDLSQIKALCDELSISHYIVQTEIGKIVFDERKESNPCALCSKLRKGALNDEAIRLGCNKVAYGHHMDDVITTMLLSLIYEGRFSTFEPVTHWDKTDLTLIRPFIYFNESEIIGFTNKYNIPVMKSPCPANKQTKREYANGLLRQINLDNPGVKVRLMHAIKELPYWQLPN